jgi:hypothetical protein
MKRKIGIALIFGGDSERRIASDLAVQGFAKAISAGLDVHITVVSFQPNLQRASLLKSALMALGQSWREIRWGRYLRRPLGLGVAAFGLIRLAVEHLARSNQLKQQIPAARANTGKQIRAWQYALDTDWDFLLVVEDDVVLNDGYVALAGQISAYLQKASLGRPIFASLADAYSAEQLGIGSLIERREAGLIFFKRPVSNTAAAYLANRSLLSAFLNEINARPSLQRIPVDWMINEMFMTGAWLRKQKIECFHSENGIFVNRSLKGTIRSQIQG